MSGEFGSVLVYSEAEVIGDGILKLPFLAALRAAWPKAQLTWATAKSTVYASVLEPVAGRLVDEVLENRASELGTNTILRRPFGGRKFDLVIDTQAHAGRTLAVRRTRHGVFVSESMRYLLSDRRPGAPPPETILGRLMLLASLAAGRPLSPVAPPAPPGDWEAAARELLPDEHATYIGIAPGAGGKNKCWPLENYIALARALAARGMVPVLLLGPEEKDWVPGLKAALPGALFPEWDRRDPYPHLKGPCLAIALSRRLAAGVANNASPAQMMAAGGAPVLALHETRRSAAKFRPFGERVETLAAEDFGEGIGAIPSSAVEDAILRLIA